MANQRPINDGVFPQSFGESIQPVSNDAENALAACGRQGFDT
jgi:hypothetical protein